MNFLQIVWAMFEARERRINALPGTAAQKAADAEYESLDRRFRAMGGGVRLSIMLKHARDIAEKSAHQ